MNGAAPLRPAAHVAAAEIDGEAVLLNVSSGVYFGLNPVATRIWQLIGEGTTTDGIVRALLAEYDVDETVVRSDVTRTVQQLAADGLIDVAAA